MLSPFCCPYLHPSCMLLLLPAPFLVCNKLRHLSKVNKVTNSLNIYLQFFGLANNLCNAIQFIVVCHSCCRCCRCCCHVAYVTLPTSRSARIVEGNVKVDVDVEVEATSVLVGLRGTGYTLSEGHYGLKTLTFPNYNFCALKQAFEQIALRQAHILSRNDNAIECVY